MVLWSNPLMYCISFNISKNISLRNTQLTVEQIVKCKTSNIFYISNRFGFVEDCPELSRIVKDVNGRLQGERMKNLEKFESLSEVPAPL